MCRLTWAQAAICHPTLASLILILRPAWPSRPTVSSPQKGFLLGGGGCGGGGVGGETKAGRCCGSWGAPHPGPLTWSLARWGRQPRQTASCLLPAATSSSSLFYQPHTPQGLTERQKRGRRKRPRRGVGGWVHEHNEETDTDYPDPLLQPPFIFGYGPLYSLQAGCCPLLLSPV